MKKVFHDRAVSPEELVRVLRSPGLIIDDEARALQIFENISYNRFKSYLVPFMEDRSRNIYREGATLEDVYALYGFDRRFRELIFHELEKVEVSIRARMGYASANADAGYWYTNSAYFYDVREHRSLMRRISSEVHRSDNDSVIRFYEKYSNDLPPCWLALEATSMGTLSSIYELLNPGPMKSSISEYYGVAPTVFESWLEHLVYIRNTCAHHSRLWNKKLSVQAMVPQTPMRRFPPQAPDAGRHVYLTLCIIKYLQDKVKPTNTFAARLRSLIGSFRVADVSQMGFPADWTDDPFWAVR